MASWQIDPNSGDYVMEKGAPISSDRLLEPAYYRLKTQRTQWLYAPNADFGSDFYAVRQRGGRSDPRTLIDIAERALEPIKTDGRAIEIQVDPNETLQVNRHNAALEVLLIDNQGEPETLSLPPIGG